METRIQGKTDSGYAWVVLAACVILQFLTDGIMKSFGLFYVEILAEFNESVSVTTLITGIMNGVFCLSSLPVMMYLIKIMTPRKTLIIGALITAAGYSLSCLAANIHFMFFTLSVLVGGGMSLIYPPALYLLGTYFEKRRALANGIAVSGCCIGGLLCPPLYRYLLDNYGLRGALLLTGAVLLHNLPMACLLRSNEIITKNDDWKAKYSNKDCPDKASLRLLNGYEGCVEPIPMYLHNGDIKESKIMYNSEPLLYKDKYKASRGKFCSGADLDIEIEHNLSESFKNHNISVPNIRWYNSDSVTSSRHDLQNDQNKTKCPHAVTPCLNLTFIIFIFANSLGSIVAVTFLPFLPLHARENNIDNKEIVLLMSLTGAVDFISRIVSGFLADRPQIKTHHILAVSQAVCGVAFNCNQLMTSFPGFIIFSVIIGLFGGIQLVLMYTHIVEIVGLTLSPAALAITIVCQLPTFILGPLCFGLLRDSTGDFTASYHAIGTLAILSAILYMCESLTTRCTKDTTS